VSQRALVAVAIVLYLYDERLDLYPAIGLKWTALMETEGMQSALERVCFQLIRSKDTDKVTRKMQEEILPEMTRFGSAIQDKLKQDEGDESNDDFNPEWKNMMENPGFSAKMQEFSDMQMEGIDVYMSTFSGQKFYPFFQELSNWFLPFYSTHSSLNELFNGQNQGAGIMDMVLRSGFLCSSDKYSFCFNILQLPTNYRSSMANNLGAETENYEEFKKSEAAMNPRYQHEQVSNRYIQDLYRFFNLHIRKRDFKNLFSFPLDLFGTTSLGAGLSREEFLRKMGALFFKQKSFKNALAVLDQLIAKHPGDAELLQKKGFSLQQLEKRKEALDAYLQADLVQPDSLWTLKRIATCYRLEKNPVKALEYYQKAVKLAPNDVLLTFNMGHALVESGDYASALQHYFKAEILSEESLKTWRPIAWCSLLCGKYEQAHTYYQKILQHTPSIEDYLNAGHLEWCKGFPFKAIELYKKGIRATHVPLPEFLVLFQKDMKVLYNHGINPDDVPFVKDELLYALEE
jgi:tetratricopeptide (TPR) repeat protein